jgi:hypothetical protein
LEYVKAVYSRDEPLCIFCAASLSYRINSGCSDTKVNGFIGDGLQPSCLVCLAADWSWPATDP